jgi:hypothetical protein
MVTKKMQLQIEQRGFFGGKIRQVLPYFDEKKGLEVAIFQ